MVKLTVTWRTVGDSHVCPICKALEGRTFTLETGRELVLTDPEYGIVWNINRGSEAHGKHDGSCRCHLDDFEFDYTDLVNVVAEINAALDTAEKEPMEMPQF
jgi:hypothetical protein